MVSSSCKKEGVRASIVEIGRLGRRVVRAAFEEVGRLGLREVDYRVSGNVCAFLEVSAGDGWHRIVWDVSGAVPEVLRSVRTFHWRLMEQARAAHD